WRYRLLLQKRARIGTRRAAAELAPAVFDPAAHPDRQGFQLLSRYEIPYEAAFFSRSEEDAVEAAATFGYPVALKAISPDFTHKSAAGAVVLGIDNEAKLREALKKMKERLAAQGAGLSDFLLQRMALPGPELFLGGKQDPHYGPVLILGHGGVKVESHDRFLTALAPVSPETAADMLTRLEGGPSIESRYFPELVRILVQFSKLLCGNPRLEEIDINPLRLLPETGEVKALDVRLLFQKG
ncbi:MAG TPA: acetate--CoA ligase family protein, partial [Syntrophales bacterium]|nr:acetate--CoA ligase family protein [Syntrophales bacterium]